MSASGSPNDDRLQSVDVDVDEYLAKLLTSIQPDAACEKSVAFHHEWKANLPTRLWVDEDRRLLEDSVTAKQKFNQLCQGSESEKSWWLGSSKDGRLIELYEQWRLKLLKTSDREAEKEWIYSAEASHEAIDSLTSASPPADSGVLPSEVAVLATPQARPLPKPSFLAQTEGACDVLARVLPNRVVKEDLGDALERISELATCGASDWYLRRAFLGSCCVLLLNGAREGCTVWFRKVLCTIARRLK